MSTRLAAADITHTLRRATQLILQCSASSRYPAILNFLVNSVAVSSAAAQLRFGATDLVQLSPADIRLIQLEFHIPDTVMIQWHSWAAERAYHSNDLIGAPDSRLSQGTGPGSVPCESVSADSSGGSSPPLSLPSTPSQGSSCARFDPVHAMELPSGDGVHTGAILRHGTATLVTQSHPSARQPLLLDSERPSTLIIEGFKS